MFDQAAGKQHNTAEAAPNELKLGESGEGDEIWPSGRPWRLEVFKHRMKEKT